jgi:hypothetical protein
MNSSTALIIHPEHPMPRRRLTFDGELMRLESHGPNIEANGRVNYSRGMYLPLQSFEEFTNRADFPTRPQRAPEPQREYDIDEQSMRRVLGLLGTLTTTCPRTARAIREMRYRILITHPHCDTAIW